MGLEESNKTNHFQLHIVSNFLSKALGYFCVCERKEERSASELRVGGVPTADLFMMESSFSANQ